MQRRKDAVKPWINRLAFYTQIVLTFVSALVATILILGWLQRSRSDDGQMLWILCLLYLQALVVHELGHYVAARLCGMTVWQCNVAGLEFKAQRRGWRVRRSGLGRLKIGGYVLAFPTLDRPMRPQILGMTVGGPAANLIIALACGLIGWALLFRPAAGLWFAMAAINASFGLINLVPHQGVMASDGLKLLTWLRGVDENAPSLAHTRLISRSIAGQTADELPESDLAAMEQLPVPMSLAALWYRLKADQNRGDWAQAITRGEQLKILSQTLTPAQITAFAETLATIRTELAFSQAMLSQDGSALTDDLLSPRAAWSAPWLQLRCHALSSALQGDRSSCEELLDISRRKAEKSIDRALPRSEALLRGYVLAIFAEGQPHVLQQLAGQHHVPIQTATS